MHDYRWTALVTIGVTLLLFIAAWIVGIMRHKYGVKAPATTGHPMFERAYRVQMNTIENALAFLPVLWLFAIYVDDRWAALLGALWLAARAWYAAAYLKNPDKRGPGFTLSTLVVVALAAGAAFGVLRTFL
jgi:glutathione S-transferase